MAQLTSIVLNDGTANVTFLPHEITSQNVARLRTTAETVIGAEELSVQARDAVSNRRVTLKVTLPVVQNEVINGITTPKVVRQQIATVELSLPKTSVKGDRKRARNLIASALSNALIAAVIDSNESLY